MIIDADAHVRIPEQMFIDRLPPNLQPKRPRQLVLDGKYFWLIEGRLVPKPAGRGAGTPGGFTPSRVAPPVPKDYYLDNVQGRLEDMDQEGIQVQVIYPDLLMVDAGIQDCDLACAMARAFNDHIAERCAPEPNRLKRVAVVALQDPQEAASELRRCLTELGCRGVVIPALLGERLLNHRDFEPFFEEANRLAAAVAIHAVTGVYSMPWQDLFMNNFATHLIAMPLAYMVALTSLFDGNMVIRYPNIRFAFLEGGCGWAPYWIRRIDEHIEDRRHNKWQSVTASELVQQERLFFACEPGEYELAHAATELGDACILYSSDYPHGDSKWPRTVQLIEDSRGLSPEAKQKILGINAAHYYALT